MARKRRAFSAAFKAQVALEACKELKTIGELAKEYQVHPTQIALWKKRLIDELESVFDGASIIDETPEKAEKAELCKQIDLLTRQLEWLKAKVAEHGG